MKRVFAADGRNHGLSCSWPFLFPEWFKVFSIVAEARRRRFDVSLRAEYSRTIGSGFDMGSAAS